MAFVAIASQLQLAYLFSNRSPAAHRSQLGRPAALASSATRSYSMR